MFGMYGHRIAPCSITTGSTFSTITTLPGGYNFYAVSVGTFAVGLPTATANVYVQVSNTTVTSTFQRVKLAGQYSAGSGIQDWEVPSSTGNYIAVCPALTGWNYCRVEVSTAATAIQSVQIHSMM